MDIHEKAEKLFDILYDSSGLPYRILTARDPRRNDGIGEEDANISDRFSRNLDSHLEDSEQVFRRAK